MKTNRVFCVAMAIALMPAGAAQAYLINSVSVLPPTPTTATPVSLDVFMTTPGTPAFLFAPTTTSLNGNSFSVGVFLDSGPLTALDTLTETVPLGTLPAGAYNYTVTLHPAMDVPFGRDMRVVMGAFTVVPEPSALVLGLVAATTSLMVRRRRSAE